MEKGREGNKRKGGKRKEKRRNKKKATRNNNVSDSGSNAIVDLSHSAKPDQGKSSVIFRGSTEIGVDSLNTFKVTTSKNIY